MQIEDRCFLITGGASGLGEATARMLVAHGGRVMLVDLNPEAGQALCAALGPSAAFARADVTQADDLQAAIDAALSRFGRLDGLVCCAGVAPGEKVLGKNGPHGLESFVRAVQINLVGTFNAIRLASAAMARGTPGDDGARGVIVCTASVAAFDGQVGQAAYSASKAGVVGMTLPIARELARHGIRVVTIAPGIFETPMLKTLPQAAQDSLGKQVPFPPRLGRPAEFAHLVRSAIENDMLNGEVIRLDGAIRMTSV